MMAFNKLVQTEISVHHDVIHRITDAAAEMGVGSDVGVVSGDCRIDGDSQNDSSLG